MSKAFLRIPGDAQSLEMGATRCVFHVTGADTDGYAGMFELYLEPGARGAGLHLHKHLTELFYVVEGEVTLVLGDRQVIAPAGATMFVPPGTAHAFSNPGQESARLLFVFWPPAEREQFFRGLLRMAQQTPPPSQSQLQDFFEQFDQYALPE